MNPYIIYSNDYKKTVLLQIPENVFLLTKLYIPTTKLSKKFTISVALSFDHSSCILINRYEDTVTSR